MMPLDSQQIIEQTRRWIRSMVIGLNLCPFAKRVFDEEKIRYVVTDVADPVELLAALDAEVSTLVSQPIRRVETTLLIHPLALLDFADYNDFLDDADSLLSSRKLAGVIQIASFHPDYQFADTQPDSAENYTNRSPFPMLHLLREVSIEKVADSEEMLADIPQNNIETLNKLGLDAVKRMRDEAMRGG